MTFLHTLTKWHMPNLQDHDKMTRNPAAVIEHQPRYQLLFLFTEVSLTAGALLLQGIQSTYHQEIDRAKKVGTQLAL
jgi:hypothetical protein